MLNNPTSSHVTRCKFSQSEQWSWIVSNFASQAPWTRGRWEEKANNKRSQPHKLLKLVADHLRQLQSSRTNRLRHNAHTQGVWYMFRFTKPLVSLIQLLGSEMFRAVLKKNNKSVLIIHSQQINFLLCHVIKSVLFSLKNQGNRHRQRLNGGWWARLAETVTFVKKDIQHQKTVSTRFC